MLTWKALVSQSTSDGGLSVGDLVPRFVYGGVSVRVCDESESWSTVSFRVHNSYKTTHTWVTSEIWFGCTHEFGAGDIDDLPFLVEACRIAKGQED